MLFRCANSEKASACACKDILDELILKWLSHRSEPIRTQEIDELGVGLKCAEIIVDIRDILEQHKDSFSSCYCPTAKHLKMIYLLPVIQESDRELLLPVSFERFWPFVKMLWMGEKFTDEIEGEK